MPGLEPNELVEVRRVAPFGAKTLVEGGTLQTKHEIQRPLSADELAQRVKVRSQAHSFDGDPQIFLFGAEAERIGIAHQFEALRAVNSSVAGIPPSAPSRGRFLPADDPGAGKAIMTGLLIKELLFRRTISKVLSITPGGITG